MVEEGGRGGGGALLFESLKRSHLPAVGLASVGTVRIEQADTSLGGPRRNILMVLKLVVSFLSQEVIL